MAFNAVGILTATFLMMYYSRENARRDREEGSAVTLRPRDEVGEEGADGFGRERRSDDGKELHDLAVGFRYYV